MVKENNNYYDCERKNYDFEEKDDDGDHNYDEKDDDNNDYDEKEGNDDHDYNKQEDDYVYVVKRG